MCRLKAQGTGLKSTALKKIILFILSTTPCALYLEPAFVIPEFFYEVRNVKRLR